MSVFLSSGLPTRNVWMRSRSFLMTVRINPFLHEQPRAGAADVALVEINSRDDAFDGLINRRVLEQNVRRLAAEFERELAFWWARLVAPFCGRGLPPLLAQSPFRPPCCR